MHSDFVNFVRLFWNIDDKVLQLTRIPSLTTMLWLIIFHHLDNPILFGPFARQDVEAREKVLHSVSACVCLYISPLYENGTFSFQSHSAPKFIDIRLIKRPPSRSSSFLFSFRSLSSILNCDLNENREELSSGYSHWAFLIGGSKNGWKNAKKNIQLENKGQKLFLMLIWPKKLQHLNFCGLRNEELHFKEKGLSLNRDVTLTELSSCSHF